MSTTLLERISGGSGLPIKWKLGIARRLGDILLLLVRRGQDNGKEGILVIVSETKVAIEICSLSICPQGCGRKGRERRSEEHCLVLYSLACLLFYLLDKSPLGINKNYRKEKEI